MSKSVQSPKTAPMRTCIVTREKLPKKDLMRLVRVADEHGNNVVKIDPFNKLKGRGANIKPEVIVLEQAFKTGAIERSLQLEYKLDSDSQERIRKDFEEALAEKQFRQNGQKVRLKLTKQEFDSRLGDF